MTRTDIVILVPRRADHAERDRLWSYCRARWSTDFPDWRIVEGHHDAGPFNRSAAVNAAADLAGDWRAAIIIDADVLPDRNAIESAIEVALAGRRAAIGYNRRLHLTAKGTTRVLDGYRGNWEPLLKHDLRDAVSGAFAIGRDLWEDVGGFDELFVGWGWEDVAFHIATETVAGRPPARIVGNLWHLWHPRSSENDAAAPTFAANKERGDRYKRARWNRPRLDALLAEAGRARAPRLTRDLELAETAIPRVLHRTVPEKTSDEVETFWRRAVELHPSWVAHTWRDPLDPADWPETGDLWERCSSGAQRAGLIRLEALWRYGGIYIDSDVELYRPLDPLLDVGGFAAWEDAKVVPDAVLGARPGHPALAVMLEAARRAILAGAGAWKSGPGVTTSVLPGRPDWLLLPPASFYPYHYTEKHRRHEDHATANPFAFGAHHWHHSWKGR